MMDQKLPVTQILCPGKEVRIEVVNNYGNKIITKTTVYSLDEQNLILNLPKQEGAFNQVNPNVEVIVICAHEENAGDHVFLTKFIRVKEAEVILDKPREKNGNLQLACSKVNLPFSYFINDKEVRDGIIETLSCTSLVAFIKPDDSLDKGVGILFKLILPLNSGPLLIMGTIVELMKEKQGYRIVLDFSHISLDLQDPIAKYLFKLQGFNVKKEQQKTAFIKIN
jgi:hypothetical protein